MLYLWRVSQVHSLVQNSLINKIKLHSRFEKL
jgi:hypothetical protein